MEITGGADSMESADSTLTACAIAQPSPRNQLWGFTSLRRSTGGLGVG